MKQIIDMKSLVIGIVLTAIAIICAGYVTTNVPDSIAIAVDDQFCYILKTQSGRANPQLDKIPKSSVKVRK